MGTLHEDHYKFLISRSFLRRMGNVADKSSRENQNTHFYYFFFRKSCCLCDNSEKNMLEPDGPQMTI